MNSQIEDPIFTFAVIADTHMRPEEGDESSPWEANKKANERARYVVERLREAAPDFAIHVGDIVHPVPVLPTYTTAADAANLTFSGLDFPVHFIPGNHDVGDKPMAGLPAARVTEEAIEKYVDHFGAHYANFAHKGCKFVLINAQLINSGLPSEVAQKEWLEDVLAERSSDDPLFLFTHYPPYLLQPDEESNYDNIDEPGRSWFLDLIERANVTTLFAGHVHHFFYHHHRGTQHYLMPSTCFTRQDYSELFRAPPHEFAEFGRDDFDKLGFCLVDVYADKHIVRIFRTHGEGLDLGKKLPDMNPVVKTHHPMDHMVAPVGLHMRHPWAEVVELPHNPLDEFVRKQVRNDYPIMAMWELGVRRLRVPISDLMIERSRERMTAMRHHGINFVVFCMGLPTQAQIKVITENGDIIESLEIIYDWLFADDLGGAIKELKTKITTPIQVSRVESGREKKREGSKFSHFVSSGFGPGEWDVIDSFRSSTENGMEIDGYGFRIGQGCDIWKELITLSANVEARKINASVYVRLASENPAAIIDDNLVIANRVAETIVASFAAPNLDVFLDTFADMDRGYFPRHGLYDRRYNPREASYIYKNLQSYLSDLGGAAVLAERTDTGTGQICLFGMGGKKLALVLPCEAESTSDKVSTLTDFTKNNDVAGEWIDLITGEVFGYQALASTVTAKLTERLGQGHPALIAGV